MATREQHGSRKTGRPVSQLLASAYELVSWSFVYPEAMDESAFSEEAATLVPKLARRVDETAAEQLARFLDEFDDVGTDHYVDTLELEPACPPYLGHYVFDEPATCRDIADADRNQYMVELAGIYEHYGLEIADELPDFVPAMAEFLALTVDHRGDALRQDFLERFVELLPEMVSHFEDNGTPYQYPLFALHRIATVDLETGPAENGPEDGGDH